MPWLVVSSTPTIRTRCCWFSLHAEHVLYPQPKSYKSYHVPPHGSSYLSPMALLPYHLDTTVLGVLALLVIHNLYQRRKNPSRLPYPPGPPPLPIIGNLLDIPVAVREPWKTYATLSQRYGLFIHDLWSLLVGYLRRFIGDIVRLSALGQNIVILGSLQPCIDLLEKRSNIYSSRPHSTMLADLSALF